MRSAWAKLRQWLGGQRGVALALFLVAFGVRLWKLADSSLWFDEVLSIYWASQSVERLLRVAFTLSQEPHPPLYYFLLKPLVLLDLRPLEVWLRLPSVIMGALTAVVGWHMARRWFGPVAGWVAAGVLTFNPWLVWHQQEARMYAQVILLLTLAWWAWVSFLEGGRPRAGLAYVLAMVAAVYSYLLALVWLPAQGALWLWRWVRQRRCAWAIAGPALVALAALPPAWHSWSGAGGTVLPHGEPPPLLATVWHIWKLWLGGRREGPEWAIVGLAWLGLGLLLLGVAWPERSRWRWGVVAAGVLPWLTHIMLALRDPIVIAEVRYPLITFPGIVLAWARGVQKVWDRTRVGGVLLAVALVVGQVWALLPNWDPQNRREDWRYVGRYLMAHLSPRDGILVHPNYVLPALDLYLPADVPRYTPITERVDLARLEPIFLEIAANHDTIWLVESHTQTFDPDHQVQQWFGARFPLVTEQYPAGVVLKGYATRYRYAAVPSWAGATVVNVPFEGGVDLLACRIWEPRVRARDDRAHPPSGWVHVTLYWQAREPVAADFTPLVRLADARGVWGERLYRDGEVMRRYPTSQWLVGEVVRDEHDINLNPVTPPGQYTVLVGLARPDGTQVMRTSGEPWAVCGTVEVIP